jgi:hypothetical protein
MTAITYPGPHRHWPPAKAAVVDKLRELHTDLRQEVAPKTGFANYTARQAAEDWLAHGLDGHSAKTIKKNQNMIEPIVKVIGTRKLRELSTADVRQALSTTAAEYSSAAVTMGTLALKRCSPRHRRRPRPHTIRS